jgi:hypothetical protein
MESLSAASAPYAPPAIPAAWIASGVVTPVIASPAATAATAWVPQPVYDYEAPTGNGSMLDALAASIMGGSPGGVSSAGDAAYAHQQLAMQQQAALDQQHAMQQAALQQQVVAPPPHMAAPHAAAAPAAPAAAAAPSVAAPADPSRIASVAGAIAGFASATGRAVGSAVGVATGAGVSTARRVGNELWAGVRSPRSIHVSQVPSKFNPAPASGNRDCGPASVVMTLRLLGKAIPGTAANATPQRMINRVRQLSGNVANTAATTNHELGRALNVAGAKTREIADAVSIRQAVHSGKPVILNGNPRNAGAYGPSFSAAQMAPYDGAHWIVVSGYDTQTGKFIINDPLSKVGPVKVSPSQLEAYRGGSLGIEVEA